MSTFRDGYDFFAKNMGASETAVQGADYISSVEYEIGKMESQINGWLNGKNTSVASAAGDAAEYWHAGTYNIHSALRGSQNRIEVASGLRSELGSPDIISKSGDAGAASLKYYATGEASAKEQAKSLYERYMKYRAEASNPVDFEEYQQKCSHLQPNDPLYSGQIRIIPKEQVEAARLFLEKQIHTESARRPEQVKRYQDALNLLQDRIKDSGGNESIPLSKAEAEKIARLAKEGNFDASAFDISAKNLLKTDYIRAQAFHAGLSAAAITVALKTAPEIVKGIRHLIETGEIDPVQMRKTGETALSSGAEGFLRGMVSAAITIACKSGLWGEALTAVSPSLVGGIIVFAFDAVKGGIGVIIHKKNADVYANEMAGEAFAAAGSLAVGSALNIILPGIGFVAGSLIGSMLGSYAYHLASNQTAADEIVAFFRNQALRLEAYAAELFKIDLDNFIKITDGYIAAAERVCAARNEADLNAALRESFDALQLDYPWQGEFNDFMSDQERHLVFH